MGSPDAYNAARPVWDELHAWLRMERARVPDGGGIAAAIDYSLRRWYALGEFLRNGDVAIDDNHIENQTLGDGPQGMALRRQRAGGQALRHGHEPRAVGTAEWPRTVGVAEGRARPTAGASGQPHRRIAAAPLVAGGLIL
jgi:hypothetical protein